jgi:hypothetical protein
MQFAWQPFVYSPVKSEARSVEPAKPDNPKSETNPKHEAQMTETGSAIGAF